MATTKALHYQHPLSLNVTPIHSWGDAILDLTADFDANFGGFRFGQGGKARQGYVLSLRLRRHPSSAAVSQSQAADAFAVFRTRSTLQSTVSLSTCEAELTAATFSAQSLVGVVNITKEVFGEPRPLRVSTPEMYGDNESANLIGSNSATARNVRHLSLQNLFVRELTRDHKVKIKSKRSKEMTADLLTKILPKQNLKELLDLLHLMPLA